MKNKAHMEIFSLLLFCSGLFAVKHSLKYFVTGSSGVPNIPEFVGVLMVDGIQTGYCDSSSKTLQPQQDWAKKLLENNTQQRDWYNKKCFEDQPKLFKDTIFSLKQQFNQSDAVHILQIIEGCEWDENTGEVTGVLLYAYNGEAFMDFDLKTLTWIALKPEAVITKQKWDTDRLRIKHKENDLTNICPAYLKMYVDHKKGFSQKKVLPSVFLLQKTPSSPVSCHATGFYPGRAVMFWRKDGEELHKGLDPGKILTNNDDTFQMSVDLIVSSITPEDWRKYECVFQLSGVEDIVTKPNEAVIRTNTEENIRKENASSMMIPIIAAVVVLVLILGAAVGFADYKKKKKSDTEPSPGNTFELEILISERLNPEPAQTNTAHY
ncbi:major histocompatibility complex class I-related gene protein-like isoform X1 [Simochromis diagramma]|uniref:major histocompatibility complex class I-related gene protein-like isoform X1 n=1 Tax=Simochromis diagramma TaxID=43689 RepID=UPI001A7EEB68|nr:major histocompatibility complex class I-related gene protein-like isoform X1 [Simochromis diagramma]